VIEELPATEVGVLVGQVTQLALDVSAEVSRNLPARQFVHVIVPLVGLYFPGTHAAHVHELSGPV
jgi:hypothetical protein